MKNKADKIKEQVKLYEKAIAEKVGRFILGRRKEKGVIIKDLNVMTGVGTAVISDLENGLSLPRIETLLRICEALDISSSTLFEQMKIDEVKLARGSKAIVDDTNKYDRLSTGLTGFGFTKEDTMELVSYARYLDFKKQGNK